jgi:hypothetical protein
MLNALELSPLSKDNLSTVIVCPPLIVKGLPRKNRQIMTVFTTYSQLSLFAIQWQDMFNPHPEVFTSAFCAVFSKTKSVY